MRCFTTFIHTLIVLSTVGMMLAGCQTSDSERNAQVSKKSAAARNSVGAEVIEVKGLDDPENPYKGMYQKWDLWVYANLVPMRQAWKFGERPESWSSMGAEVDENGYMIPMLESIRLREEAIANGTYSEYRSDIYEIYAEGEISRDVEEDYLNEGMRIRAEFVPEIPAWLADNPPKMSMLFPNGDVITTGKLGDVDEDCCSGGKMTWYRYDQSGELTGQSDVVWWEIYYSEKYGKTSWPDGEFDNRMDGYVMFKNPITGQIMSIWDYDGTQLESLIPPPTRDPHSFMYLNRNLLTAFYELQHNI